MVAVVEKVRDEDLPEEWKPKPMPTFHKVSGGIKLTREQQAFLMAHIHNLCCADTIAWHEDHDMGLNSGDSARLFEKQRRAIRSAFPLVTDEDLETMDEVGEHCPFTDINQLLFILGCVDRYRRA